MIKWYASLGLVGLVIVATTASVRSSQGGGIAMLILPSYSLSYGHFWLQRNKRKNGKMVVCTQWVMSWWILNQWMRFKYAMWSQLVSRLIYGEINLELQPEIFVSALRVVHLVFRDTFSLLGENLYSAATRDKIQEAAGVRRINTITFIW